MINVAEGQSGSPGTILGRVGSTGRSTGPHLHYEVRIDGDAVDPGRFLRASDKVAALKTLLARIATEFPASTLASSLSIEDMVVTDAILRGQHRIEVFTLDTGRMHGDTLALVDAIISKYGYAVNVYRPQAAAVTEYITVHGRDAFYERVDLR